MLSCYISTLSTLGHYVRILGKDGDKAVETQVGIPLMA